MAAPTTQKTFRVSLSVDGRDVGVWDTKSGGKVGGNILTYLPGGMAPQISLPSGPNQQIDTITLARLYDLQRDHDRDYPFLLSRQGAGKTVVKIRPIGPDGNGHGKSEVYTGTLQSVAGPDTDSNSDSAALITVEIAPDGPVTFA